MTSFALSVLLTAALNTQVTPVDSVNDTIKQHPIKEVTVFSIANNNLSLPYVAVDKKELEAHDFKTPADALQNETGIALYRDGSWGTSVNVRGMSEQRLLFLLDEDRLQSATDIAGVLSTVDMNSLEKIEVIKGAGSVLYGTGAMGGIVNFVSERPGYSDFLNVSGKVSSGYHSGNKMSANAVNVNFTNKDFYIALNGSYRTAQNTMTPKGILPNSQFNDASWGLKGGVKYGDSQEFLVTYNHFEAWNVGIPGNSAFPSAATVRYTSIKRNQLSGEYIFSDISDFIKELKIRAYTQNISRDVENKPNATTFILPASLNRTSGVKATANLYFNDYNTMTIGAETWLRDSETGRMKIVEAVDTTVIGEIPTPKAKMWDVGVFALYKKVLDPRHLNLNAGVRLDYIRTANDTAFNRIFQYKIVDGVKNDIAFSKNVIFDAAANNNLAYSAHIDLEYIPVTQHKFVVSLANAYRVPSIEERFKYIDLGSIKKYGNPDLKSENGFFSNFSYVFTQKKISIKVDLFANYLFNMIAEVKKSSLSPDFVNKNIDEAFFAGAEIQLDWLISRNFKLNTNASYVYTKNITSGTYLPQIPPAHGMLALNYRLDHKFETALTTLWAAAQNQVASGETTTAGHVIFNYDIHSTPIKLKKSYLQLFGGVDNILDKAYKNHLFSTRGLDYYEPGRNIFVKLKWGW